VQINPQTVQPLSNQQQASQQTVQRDNEQQKSAAVSNALELPQVVPDAKQSRRQAERWQSLNTMYDEPPQRSQKALSAYQTVALNEKREEVASMFGVDVYA
jgi:hypothetical protein